MTMTAAMLHELPSAILTDDAFSLPATAFVDTWADAFGLSDAEFTPSDRDTLVAAIRGGTNRLQVIDALRTRRAVAAQEAGRSAVHSIRRPPDGFALIETFTRFAPGDDVAFLRHAFAQISGRDPSGRERLELEFDLRRGLADRAAVIRRIVELARREGRAAVWDTLAAASRPQPGTADLADARTMPAGLMIDEAGRETLVFLREMPGSGWLVSPEYLRQRQSAIVESGWSVAPGWLIVGPKRSLHPGPWRVDLDIVQPDTAMLDFDLVANSGLDVLQRLTISGPIHGSFRVEISPDHHFIELRLSVREEGNSGWLRPRNVSMQRLG